MGIFSRFERSMEDGLEGAANKMFDAPISPVQISKKAERAMHREKMVGAGKQYAPTLYTVLVNPQDDARLFGYYPTLAGETETYLSAKAAEEGYLMDGQPLVRFIADKGLKRGKFDIVAELVSAPIIAQLRAEEMQHYGLASPGATPGLAPNIPQAAPFASSNYVGGSQGGAGYANAPDPIAPAQPYVAPASSASAAFTPAANASAAAAATPEAAYAQPAKREPLPYVPEEEIDRSIDYGEYTFNSQDWDDYTGNRPKTPFPPAGAASSSTPAAPQPYADLSGLDVAVPIHDSRDFGLPEGSSDAVASNPSVASPGAAAATPPATDAASAAMAPANPTAVFAAGSGQATPMPDEGAVRARLVNLSTGAPIALAARRLTLGRSGQNDIVIDDINASRMHAEIRLEPQGAWVISDLGSTNGTQVNGRSVAQTALHNGDRIRIGTTDFTFQAG